MAQMRRRLNAIRLTKIAAVDSPCQEHATVGIMKRREAGAEAIAKVTFQEALDGQLIASRVSEAFYSAFDGLWQRNDAFKCALTDEFKAGGDGTVASTAYIASIIQLAQDAVTAARETGTNPTDDQLNEAVDKAVAKYLTRAKETTMKTKAELLAGIAKFNTSGGTQIEIDAIRKAAVDLNLVAELPATGALAVAASDPALAAELATLKADLAKRDAVAAMTPPVRAHYDALDAAGQTAFLAKSADAREAEVVAKNAVDPVVYTTSDGTAIRKSDGPTLLAMAKRQDTLDAENKVLKGENAEADIKKRAAEFKHTANAEAILKGIDQIADEAVRKAALDGLRAADKALAPMFKRAGVNGSTGPDLGETSESPVAKLNAMANDIAKRDNVTFAKAMITATQTEEGGKLYAESVTPAA